MKNTLFLLTTSLFLLVLTSCTLEQNRQLDDWVWEKANTIGERGKDYFATATAVPVSGNAAGAHLSAYDATGGVKCGQTIYLQTQTGAMLPAKVVSISSQYNAGTIGTSGLPFQFPTPVRLFKKSAKPPTPLVCTDKFWGK